MDEKLTVRHWCRISSGLVRKDGKIVMEDPSGKGTAFLASVYRRAGLNYPKFFKMDALSKAGFIASEVLLSDEKDRFVPREDRAVLLFSSSGCEADDINYRRTITDDNYYPSPSLFVYTLPNVVTGEIAIRNLYRGETSAFVLEHFDAEEIVRIVREAFEDSSTESALAGWIECPDDDNVDALLFLAEKGEGEALTSEHISQLFGNK